MDKVEELKKLLIPYKTEHVKKRYGVNGDGGYVLSETLIKNTDSVYSLGISDEFSIDLELNNMGIKVYQYDVNFCDTPARENLFFKQLYVNASSLNQEIMINNTKSTDSNLLLMDIEGGEYDIVLNDLDVINNFSQISMEVHHIFDNEFSIDFFKKLNENFTLIHIHANNWCQSEIHEKIINGKGLRSGIADLLELTYVRNDYIKNKEILDIPCPSDIDYPNYKPMPDVKMSWWIN